MTILISSTGESPERWRDALAAQLPDDTFALSPDEGEASGIDYAVVWRQPQGVLSRLPALKAIFSLGAGVDHVLSDPTLPDVPVVRIVAEDLTNRMSEYVVWRVLDHMRQGRLYREQQEATLWRERSQPAAASVSVGILGLGELGRDAGRKLQALGFSVRGWSRTQRTLDGIETHSGPDGLAACLAASDIVVVLLPLTDETRGLIDDGFLSALKAQTPLGGPVLINAGRGGLQSDEAILRALNDGRLMEASLDVFEEEPLPTASVLWAHPRVFVTPHVAASSDPTALSVLIARQILRHRAGESLVGIVDRTAGY